MSCHITKAPGQHSVRHARLQSWDLIAVFKRNFFAMFCDSTNDPLKLGWGSPNDALKVILQTIHQRQTSQILSQLLTKAVLLET